MAVAAFNVALTASVSRFVAPVRNAERTWNSLARSVQRGSSQMTGEMRRTTLASIALARHVTRAAVAVGGLVTGLTVWGIRLAAQWEQMELGFETLLGSAAAARRMLADLVQLAARTPLQLRDVASAARQLLAAGMAEEQIAPALRAIADAVGAIGGGRDELERITRALAQMTTKGRVAAEEMNQQLVEIGIPAWEMLAEALGVSVPEAMQLVERRAVSAAVGVAAILQGIEQRWAGAAERQARTLAGRLSTLRDNIEIILLGLGRDAIEATRLADAIAYLTDVTSRFAAVVTKLGFFRALEAAFPPWLPPVIVAIAGAITGAMIPAVAALIARIKALIVAQGISLALMGPWAVAGAGLALTIWLLADAFGGLDRVAMGVLLTLGGAFLTVAALVIQGVGWILRAISWIVPALRGAADTVIEFGRKQQQVAMEWFRTAFGMADAAQQTGQGASDAAKRHEKLAKAIEAVTSAANDNIQSFDEVHQLQQELAQIDPSDLAVLPPPPVFPEPPAGPGGAAGGGGVFGDLGGGITNVADAARGAMTMLAKATDTARYASDLARQSWRESGIQLDSLRQTAEAAAESFREKLAPAMRFPALAPASVPAPVLDSAWDQLPQRLSERARAVERAWSPPALSVPAPTLAPEWTHLYEVLRLRRMAIEAAWSPPSLQPIPAPMLEGWDERAQQLAEARQKLLDALLPPLPAPAAVPAPSLAEGWQMLPQELASQVQRVAAAWQPPVLAPVAPPALSPTWDSMSEVLRLRRMAIEAAWQPPQFAPIEPPVTSAAWASAAEEARRLGEEFESASKTAVKALGDVGAKVQRVTGHLENMSRAIEGVHGAWTALSGSLANAAAQADKSAGALQQSVQNLSSAAKSATDSVKAGFAGAASQVQASSSQMESRIQQLASQAASFLQQLAQRGVDSLQQLSVQGQVLAAGLVVGVLAALHTLYQEAVGQSIIPDFVQQSLSWLKRLHDGGTDLIDRMTTRIGITLSDAFDRYLAGGMQFGDLMTAIFASVGDAARRFIAEEISKALAQSLSGIGQWVVGVLARAASVVGAFISQAYSALLALFAWMGPFAPVAAAGVIAAGLVTMGKLAAQAMGLVKMAEGGIVTGPTFAMLGEGGRREAVVPLERDNVLADSIGDAVYEAMTAALAQLAGAAPASAGERELVLRLDGTTIARVLLPALEREAERRGMKLLVRPGVA